MTKIFPLLSPKANRLPKETGLGGPSIRPAKAVKLTVPEATLRSNKAIMADLEKFSAVSPANIRADAKARLQGAVDAVNMQIQGSMQFKHIRFGVHQESGRSFAVVRDQRSGEVLKTIPADTFLEMSARLQDASGILTDLTI